VHRVVSEPLERGLLREKSRLGLRQGKEVNI
jgi:hypothetical protein